MVRRAPAGACGSRPVECLLAARFTRESLRGVRWQSADAIRIVQDASAELRLRLSALHEPLPLDLAGEPGLAALARAIDKHEPGAARAGLAAQVSTVLLLAGLSARRRG